MRSDVISHSRGGPEGIVCYMIKGPLSESPLIPQITWQTANDCLL